MVVAVFDFFFLCEEEKLRFVSILFGWRNQENIGAKFITALLSVGS